MNRALARCYRICGSQAAFARLIGVSGSALTKWNKFGVPPRRVRQIVAVMNGAVEYHELRPDMYPRPQDASGRSFAGVADGAELADSTQGAEA